MNLFISAAIICAFFLSARLVHTAINRYGHSKAVGQYRLKYISKTLNLTLAVFFFILLVSFHGVEYSQISIFLSSIFAVLGVALFAQWSILSNVTASLIIFFGFPYRVGDYIRVVDKDDDIVGVIEEIALFHVLIKRGEELITYPNTLILQKAVVKDPRKLPAKSESAEDSSELHW